MHIRTNQLKLVAIDITVVQTNHHHHHFCTFPPFMQRKHNFEFSPSSCFSFYLNALCNFYYQWKLWPQLCSYRYTKWDEVFLLCHFMFVSINNMLIVSPLKLIQSNFLVKSFIVDIQFALHQSVENSLGSLKSEYNEKRRRWNE